MKNRLLIWAMLASGLSAVTLVAGQDPSTTAPSEKIGVVSIQQAIAATGEGKQAFDQLQRKYEPKKQQLQRDQDAINTLQDQLQKQGPTLSDEERARLTRELDEKQRLFKREQEDDQSDFQADQQETFNRIGQKMIHIINDYAAKNGFGLVIDPIQVQMPIYYVAKGIDITDSIVKLYDQANPAPAAAASAPASSAAKPAQKPAKP
ncbi:MAG TPA: OmpH family outer membrane protein [Terriglobia bacterium]